MDGRIAEPLMQNFSHLRLRIGQASCFLFLFLHAACPLAAQSLDKNNILQNKADEQAVRQHTAAVVAQIQGLIDELASNGISGDDTKVLDATKAALANLSGPEMERVISSLQQAGDATTVADTQQHVVDAYADQKGIILQFRQILRDYEQRQAAYELPLRFKELGDRQTETMRTSADVARASGGKPAAELTTMEQTTQQIVQADQAAISNETSLAIEQLNKAAADSTQDDAQVLQQAQLDIQSGVVQKALADANDSIKAGKFFTALNAQKIARDELRRIAADLSPPANAVDALSASEATLEKIIAEQKSLVDQTTEAVNNKPRTTGLDEKQAVLVDETNSLQQDMQTTAAAAAGPIKDAIAPMQQSRAALGSEWNWEENYPRAILGQNAAIEKLEVAEKILQQQVADAQKAAEDAGKNPVAKLQDLKNQIESALQTQKQITNQTQQANTTNPPAANTTQQNQQAQSQLQQQTVSMQQSSQPLSLPASQALATASQAMQQAQQDMTDSSKTPADTQQQQQAAQAALTQADQQVQQQIAQDQQETADPAALAQAQSELQQAQSQVSTALSATTPPSSQSSSKPPAVGSHSNPPATPPNMAEASKALVAAAEHTQAAAAKPGLPSSAAAAVQQAQVDIAQGRQSADKGDAPATSSAAAAAEQSLAQAQASIAMAQAGLATGGIASGKHPAPGKPGMAPAPPGPEMHNKDGAKTVTGGNTDKGTLHDVSGDGKFVTVAARDRAAIDQTQEEKRPQEYAPMIDQYMKNLADQSSTSP